MCMAPDLHRDSLSGHSLSGVLDQQYQHTVFLASQRKHLAVQYHWVAAQVNVQMSVVIWIEAILVLKDFHVDWSAGNPQLSVSMKSLGDGGDSTLLTAPTRS